MISHFSIVCQIVCTIKAITQAMINILKKCLVNNCKMTNQTPFILWHVFNLCLFKKYYQKTYFWPWKCNLGRGITQLNKVQFLPNLVCKQKNTLIEFVWSLSCYVLYIVRMVFKKNWFLTLNDLDLDLDMKVSKRYTPYILFILSWEFLYQVCCFYLQAFLIVL